MGISSYFLNCSDKMHYEAILGLWIFKRNSNLKSNTLLRKSVYSTLEKLIIGFSCRNCKFLFVHFKYHISMSPHYPISCIYASWLDIHDPLNFTPAYFSYLTSHQFLLYILYFLFIVTFFSSKSSFMLFLWLKYLISTLDPTFYSFFKFPLKSTLFLKYFLLPNKHGVTHLTLITDICRRLQLTRIFCEQFPFISRVLLWTRIGDDSRYWCLQQQSFCQT